MNSRRTFIKNTGIVSLGFFGLNQFALAGSHAKMVKKIGPLVYKNGGILSLPEGFSAKVISRTGDIMHDGLSTPGAFDGMGVFEGSNDRLIIIRNHELSPGSYGDGPFGERNKLLSKIDKNKIYDFAKGKDRICVGGTTTLLYNEQTQNIDTHYLSLTGTVRNCSGGKTPWNSWITCEETAFKMGEEEGHLEKDHGYNFEVPASERIGLIDPLPIKDMGRFVHESVAVHPTLGIVYQTEDEGDSLFYRFLPNAFGKLHQGGKLQCLVINEWKSADTRNWKELTTDRFPEKKSFDVSWIDLDNVENANNDLRFRGLKMGAAIFASGEGMSYGKNELFFTASSGGVVGNGQIFRYTPSKYEGQPQEKDHPAQLELFLESKNNETFQFCDNLTVAPWGDVIICEDNVDARIIGITPKGESYVIAQNVGYRESEFAGPVFSPSGRTLFINIQSPGLTLAITGPWHS
jgi:secreted PhoX family phosphatase